MDTASEIKNKLDITDIVGSYVDLKKSGKNYKGVCPFHSEDTPSFMVSPDIQIYKCFGCGEGGDMFSFVQKMEGIEFYEAMEILAERAGVKIEKRDNEPNYSKKKLIYTINDATSKFYEHLLLNHGAGKKALAYLKDNRKLDMSVIKEFRLGYAPDNWDILTKYLIKKGFGVQDIIEAGVATRKKSGDGFIDKFRGRIVFPFIDLGGNIVGFSGRDIIGRDPKYLNTQETIVFNKSAFLYGLNNSKVDIKKHGAIFVEGQVDVLSAQQHGIKNVVASSGTALTKTHLRVISRYTEDLTLCFDPDSAGMLATARALENSQDFDFNIKVAIIPEKYSDLDDYLKKAPDDAKEKLKNAVPVYDFYLLHALKTFSKDSAYNKKKIVEYLVPVYSKIQDKVVLDHYIQKVAEELELNPEVFRDYIEKGVPVESVQKKQKPESSSLAKEVRAPEEVLLAIILQAPLDTMGSFVYKLSSSDFGSEINEEIFKKLKKKLSEEESLDIQKFLMDLSDEAKIKTSEMYLWDFEEILSEEKILEREVQNLLERVKQSNTKKELREISEKIKLAELEKDSAKLEKLLKNFKRLSQKLK